MAINVSGLTTYVEECGTELLPAEIFNKSGFLDADITWMYQIKTSSPVVLLSVDSSLQDCECGFSPASDTNITARDIEVSCIQVMGEICDLDLTEYFTGKYIRRTAGDENIDTELYREFIEAFLGDIRKKVEKLVFQGDKTKEADKNLNRIDGILKICDGEADVTKVDITTGNPMSALLLLCTKITGAMYNRGNVTVICDPSVQYSLAMSQYMQRPYDGGMDFTNFTKLPNGLNLLPAEGLRGTGKVIITPLSNIVAGTDFANDRETFKFWFSDDNQVWRYIVKFYIGVQIAVPSEVIVGSLSQDVLDNVSMGQIDVKNVG